MLADEDERVVLSRGDTCLRGADVALLRGPHWLNDHLITFFFTHLTETHASDDVLLVDGSVAFFMAHCEAEDAAVVTAPLGVATRALVLCAVSDASVGSANGGSHWTLLAYRRSDGVFRHYDSLGRSGNAAAAARIATTLAPALGLQGKPRIQAAPAPQQANGYDCALHVLLTAQLLCAMPEREPSSEELAARVTPGAATALRADMLALIARLAAEEADAPWDD